MESIGKFEKIFYKLLESNTAGAGGSLGDGESMHDITKYADGDARKPALLGKVVSRAGTVGGKKKKKKKEVDGLDGLYLSGEDEETLPEEDAEKVDKDRMKCNSPRRTSGGSKKFVVKACKDGKEKIIRFGQVGVKGAGKKPKTKKDKARKKSFQARHAKNIAKGVFSAAYWANKVKW